MKRVHVIVFLVWLVLLNWPPILIWIPSLNLLCFLPYLFWIYIPALWLGLAMIIGQPHYDIQEFGAWPQTPLAWFLIVVFWLLVTAGLTVLTASVARLLNRRKR